MTPIEKARAQEILKGIKLDMACIKRIDSKIEKLLLNNIINRRLL